MSLSRKPSSSPLWLLPFMCALSSATCLWLDDTSLKNRCDSNQDCNAGRVCVEGVCESPWDAAPNLGQPDSPGTDEGDDASDDRPSPAPDAPVGDVVDAGAQDADGDADEDVSPDSDDQDTPPEVAPDPCNDELKEAQAPSPDFLSRLAGSWRLCRGAGQDAGDQDHWLLGPKDRLDFATLAWRRASADTRDPSPETEGVYYAVLEGSNVLYLARAADGSGFMLSTKFAGDRKTVILNQCNTPTDCSGLSARLLFDNTPAVPPDAGAEKTDADVERF